MKTKHTPTQNESALVADILQMINSATDLESLIRSVVAHLQTWSGCEAVGIRLRDGDDYPYYYTSGFPAGFVRLENSLCARDDQGEILRDPNFNPILECMCGNILQGRFDPSLPFFSKGGSFWSSGTSQLLANTSETDRQARTRNRCNGEGYESVALIPLRAGGQTFGLIQLNDKRTGRFDADKIVLFERISNSISVYLAKAQYEQRLKQSEASLRQERQRLANVIASINIGTWEWNVQSGALVVNQRWAEIIGYTLQELEPASIQNWLALVHPDDLSRTNELFEDVLAGKQEFYDCEYRMRHKQGHWVWLHGRGRVVEWNPDGRALLISGAHSDINDRKTAEEKLRTSEERYRLLVEAANEGILIAQDGWAKFFNPRLLEIIDRTAEEFAGAPFVEFIHPDDRALVFGNYQRRIAGEYVPTGYAFRIMDGHSHVKWVSINSALVDWDGRPATLNLITDITEARQAEADLRLWADAFQYCSHGIAIGLPSDNTILTCNPSFARIHSSSEKAIAGRPILSIYDPAEHELVKKSIAQADRLGHATYEAYMIRDDGSKFPVQMDVVSVRTPTDEILYRVATMQDISERRQAEDALRQSEERFRRIVETANEGIWAMDGDFLTTFVNSKMADMLGYHPEEMLGRTVQSFMFPEDLADHQEKMRGRQKGQSGNYERRFRAKNGSAVWTIVSATALQEADGSFTGSFGMFTNITERKLAEEKLTRSQEALRGLLDATTDSVHLLDLDLRVIISNEVAADRLGMKVDEMLGRCVLDFFPPEVSRRRRDVLQEVLATGRPQRLRDERDGRHFESHVFPVRDDQGLVSSLAIYARDITKEVEAEGKRSALERQLLQAQKLEAIGTLAGGIAHDFNNLLASIIGYSEMAMDDAKSGKADPRDIEHVLKAAERARLLVRQILTFSRKAETNFMPLDLNKEVSQATQLLGKTIPKMVAVQTDLAPDLWKVNADPTQVEQILLNMGVNASDAIGGQGTIRIKTENRIVHDQLCFTCGERFSGHYAILEITDDGQGIDGKDLEHIFEPFFTTKEVGKGTGLGLSTVYGIVLSHRGHLSCKSSLGEGTTFTIYMPALDDDDEAAKTRSASEDDSSLVGQGRILLVDDEEALLGLGARQLSRAGYEVETASSGEQALQLYHAMGPGLGLVIMDLSMPGIGGYMAIKELLAINPQAKVIIASGYAADGQIQNALALGAAGYVAKPFKKAELLAAVKSVLNKK